MHAFKYVQIDDFIKQMLNRPEIFDIISSRNYEFDIVEEYIQNYFRRMLSTKSSRIAIEKMLSA